MNEILKILPPAQQHDLLDILEILTPAHQHDLLDILEILSPAQQHAVLDILEILSPAQQQAVLMIKTFIATYNGEGLLQDMNRYQMLEGRVRLAAIRSKDLLGFWARLRTSLGLGLSKKDDDVTITEFFIYPQQRDVINRFVNESPEIVMIARQLNDMDKADKKAQKTYYQIGV